MPRKNSYTPNKQKRLNVRATITKNKESSSKSSANGLFIHEIYSLFKIAAGTSIENIREIGVSALSGCGGLQNIGVSTSSGLSF